MKKLNYKSWLDKRINSVDYLGTDLALAAWDYQDERIANLEAENRKLKQCIEYSRQHFYLPQYVYDVFRKYVPEEIVFNRQEFEK